MSFKDFYKSNCHSPLLKPFVKLGRSVNKFYENRNYNHRTNGEGRLLQILAGFKCETIFDVGANIGNWTRTAQPVVPAARFFCFEPVIETFQHLKQLQSDSVATFNLALGPKNGPSSFFFYPDGHELSSMYRFSLHREEPREVAITMTTGDAFLTEHNIARVDFLKIDAEGYDFEVLKGFEKSLRTGAIQTIQFEYGRINIVSKSLLFDFYQFLGRVGYRIGKIYPKTVEFRDYDFELEDFIGPNFVAVRADNRALIQALSH